MSGLIGLDFETYGAVSLPDHGLARYMGDKSFTPLIGSVAWRSGLNRGVLRESLNFISDRKGSKRELEGMINTNQICAHNDGFEHGVLDHIGLDYPSDRFIDSAMVARVAGASSHLEAAAPQLLNVDKMASGRHLIKLFSIPGKYQEESGSPLFDPQIIADHPKEWAQFIEYCELDAELSLTLCEKYLQYLSAREQRYGQITHDMNRVGWPIDLELVEEMNRRYLENQEVALHEFREKHAAHELNLGSHQQVKAWCAERGVRAASVDEKNVARLLKRVEAKLEDKSLAPGKRQNYGEVRDLLRTKQILGGSSLKKLQTMMDLAITDTWNPGGHRLLDQYVHCGAGQTLRTTGRSVQMQNLKRLGAEVDDVDELLLDEADDWDNEKLAKNLRQCFTASDRAGRLIVGDFKSVESRGLGYIAGETWKNLAYQQNKDLYMVLASKIYGISYDAVTKLQRQTGKVGELSCGYGAGAGAVLEFAADMGVELSEGEAAKIVNDWRAANPKIVALWTDLDNMLHKVVDDGSPCERLTLESNGLEIVFSHVATPTSLLAQHQMAQSVHMQVKRGGGGAILSRIFHGCYSHGRNIRYYRPSDRKTGDLWRPSYTHSKTGLIKFYELYGGKLAGILTQSFCRELFMQSLDRIALWVDGTGGQLKLIGQFHDEIVVDWKPGALSLEHCMDVMEQHMSDAGQIRNFPLAADIKHDYRYTK